MELSNLGPKAFAIGAGDDEVFAEDDSSVGESLRLRISSRLKNCSRNLQICVLSFSLDFPMNNVIAKYY